MHSVNPDLLRALALHHPDGRPKDPHATHRAEHRVQLKAARRLRRRHLAERLARLWRRTSLTKPAGECP